jgi:hypothetical protein
MSDDLLAALGSDPAYRFTDWPNPEVPNWRAGVYTVWDGDLLVYVGMAGRGLHAGSHESEKALASTKARGLRDRLNSHASGRRSGNQFRVYVADRLVLPTLSQTEIMAATNGQLSLDTLTRQYIRDDRSYRLVVTEAGFLERSPTPETRTTPGRRSLISSASRGRARGSATPAEPSRTERRSKTDRDKPSPSSGGAKTGERGGANPS